VDSSLQEERDKRDFELRDTRGYFIRESHGIRYDEACEFMEKHEELVPTHKYYDMTRKEQMTDLMRRSNAAYKHGKEQWFQKHEPHLVHWAYT